LGHPLDPSGLWSTLCSPRAWGDLGIPIREMQKMVHEHAQEKGWYSQDSEEIEIKQGRHMLEFLAYLQSEVSELFEAFRKSDLFNPCNKEGLELPCISEEFADLSIISMAAAEFYGFDLETAIHLKMQYNKNRSHRHGDTYERSPSNCSVEQIC